MHSVSHSPLKTAVVSRILHYRKLFKLNYIQNRNTFTSNPRRQRLLDNTPLRRLYFPLYEAIRYHSEVSKKQIQDADYCFLTT